MGTKRIGLARTQALIENLKREIDMGAGSLKRAATALMVAGSEYGVYEAVYEIDFEGADATATDNGMLKTVCTLPANATIVDVNTICTETFAPNQTLVLDLVSTATTVADNAATTAVVELVGNTDYDPDSRGVAGISEIADNLGLNTTGVTVAFINRGTGNGTTAITAGKVLVYIRYIGQSGPSALTSL